MRQVFYQKPWIYREEPAVIRDIFLRYGTLERLQKNTPLLNGGEDGRFYYLKKGLATFAFQDMNGRSFIFSLVLPGRVLADVDGISREMVNVTDSVIRPSEVLSISYEKWQKYIGNSPELMLEFTRGIISKEETHMEAMIANYTLSVEDRLRVFLKALITSYQPEITQGWNKVPLYLSQDEYAQLVGSTRVTVNRVKAEWQKNGLSIKNKRDTAVHSDLFERLYDWTNNT